MVTNAGLSILGGALPPKLTSLSLCCAGCQTAGDDGLHAIMDGLPVGLQTLDLNFRSCKGISDSGADFFNNLPTALRSLKLCFEATNMTNAAKALLEKLVSSYQAQEKPVPAKSKRIKKNTGGQEKDESHGEHEGQEGQAKPNKSPGKRKKKAIKKNEAEKQPKSEEEVRMDEVAESRQRISELERFAGIGHVQQSEENVEQPVDGSTATNYRKEDTSLAEEECPSREERTDDAATRHRKSDGKSRTVLKRQGSGLKSPKSSKALEEAEAVPSTPDFDPIVLPKMGDYVRLRYCGTLVNGRVLYVGKPDFAPGDWVGVALDEPLSNHNGTILGVKYFVSNIDSGLFVRPSALEQLDASERAQGEVDNSRNAFGDVRAKEMESRVHRPGATRKSAHRPSNLLSVFQPALLASPEKKIAKPGDPSSPPWSEPAWVRAALRDRQEKHASTRRGVLNSSPLFSPIGRRKPISLQGSQDPMRRSSRDSSPVRRPSPDRSPLRRLSPDRSPMNRSSPDSSPVPRSSPDRSPMPGSSPVMSLDTSLES